MLNYFLSMLMLVFAVASIIGAILIVIGLVVGVLFLWFAGILAFMGAAPFSFAGYVVNGVVAVIGAIIGALIALGIFLLAIMKA